MDLDKIHCKNGPGIFSTNIKMVHLLGRTKGDKGARTAWIGYSTIEKRARPYNTLH